MAAAAAVHQRWTHDVSDLVRPCLSNSAAPRKGKENNNNSEPHGLIRLFEHGGSFASLVSSSPEVVAFKAEFREHFVRVKVTHRNVSGDAFPNAKYRTRRIL